MSEENTTPATASAIHDSIDAAIAAPVDDCRLYDIECDPNTHKFVWAKSPAGAIAAMVASWGLTAKKVKDRDQLEATRRVFGVKK